MYFKYLLIFLLLKTVRTDQICPFESCKTHYVHVSIEDLTYCSIICDNIEEEFPAIGDPESRKISEIILNNVEYIPNNAFNKLSIDKLYLFSQNLNQVSAKAFKDVKYIKYLYLYFLTDSELFSSDKLVYLKQKTQALYIENSDLDDISVTKVLNEASVLTNLITLSLQNNLIENFVYDFSKYQNLKSLNLSHNQLTNFDIKSNITYLSLSNNQIIELNYTMFEYNKKIQSLDLSYNLIEKISDLLFMHIRDLRFLNLKHNKIKDIHVTGFFSLNIINLNLGNNLIEILPDKFSEFVKNAITLDLSNNFLRDLTFLNNQILDKLLYLSLANNAIRSISQKELSNIAQLHVLDMSHNLLNEIFFPKMNSLSSLKLNNNKIRKIDKKSFKGLPNLVDLTLENNKLTEIERESFKKNTNLRSLNLKNNYLSEIPSILTLVLLARLNLENQNKKLTQLEDQAFERYIQHSTNDLEINLSKNRFKLFNDKIFCSSHSYSLNEGKKLTFMFDDINLMKPCLFAQFNSQNVIIQINQLPNCAIKSFAHNFNITLVYNGLKLEPCLNYKLNNYECSDNFLCPNPDDLELMKTKKDIKDIERTVSNILLEIIKDKTQFDKINTKQFYSTHVYNTIISIRNNISTAKDTGDKLDQFNQDTILSNLEGVGSNFTPIFSNQKEIYSENVTDVIVNSSMISTNESTKTYLKDIISLDSVTEESIENISNISKVYLPNSHSTYTETTNPLFPISNQNISSDNWETINDFNNTKVYLDEHQNISLLLQNSNINSTKEFKNEDANLMSQIDVESSKAFVLTTDLAENLDNQDLITDRFLENFTTNEVDISNNRSQDFIILNNNETISNNSANDLKFKDLNSSVHSIDENLPSEDNVTTIMDDLFVDIELKNVKNLFSSELIFPLEMNTNSTLLKDNELTDSKIDESSLKKSDKFLDNTIKEITDSQANQTDINDKKSFYSKLTSIEMTTSNIDPNLDYLNQEDDSV